MYILAKAKVRTASLRLDLVWPLRRSTSDLCIHRICLTVFIGSMTFSESEAPCKQLSVVSKAIYSNNFLLF